MMRNTIVSRSEGIFRQMLRPARRTRPGTLRAESFAYSVGPIWQLANSTLQSLSVVETLWSGGDPDHYSARGFSPLRWSQTKARASE
jgi:hypothetical protein